MNKQMAVVLLSMGAALMTALPAMAQTDPVYAAAQTPQPQGEGQRHERRVFSTPGERIEARLAYVRTALKISDAQQAQWNAFADTLRRHAAAADKQIQGWRENMKQRAEPGQPSAIERLERRQQQLAAAAARISERLAVQKPLYAVLTAEQKQIADQVLAPRGGHDRMRHRGMRRHADAGEIEG
jgi:LTXXQ motif family protein